MTFSQTEKVKLIDIEIEYERFFAFSVDMLCISSYDGHFKKVNPAFEKVLGFSAEELCTKSYLDFIHPDDIDRTTKEVERQLSTKQKTISFENRYLCIDGSYKWLSWNSAPVGQFMYAVARDITASKVAIEELRKTKEALELANQELEAFSYSVAHDLRAPVRSILGFSSLILQDPEMPPGANIQNHLNTIKNAAKKMGNLIEGLLNLSHLARKDLLKKQEVSLSAIAEETARELQNLNPKRKVHFVIAPNIIVEGDAVLLKVTLTNLMQNAWKYSSKCPHEVTIEFGSVEQRGVRVLFVKDNGVGFDMKYANKLFGVFQRLHTDEEFEGTGIGLATVQRIIRRHGGHIWATAAIDKGATFYFTF
jgi:PAS domain S-box-containing protein